MLRALGVTLPLLASVAMTLLLTRFLPPAAGLRMVLIQWVVLSAAATGVLLGVQRFARRMLPLTTLAGIDLVFPDRVPSRLKMAMRTGSVTDLDARIHQARMAGAEGDESEAAEALLELVCDLNSHDPRTKGHSERVRAMSQLIGQEMGLPEGDLDLLNWSALLHDVGKLDVDRSVLNKSTELTKADWDALRQHPQAGERLVRPLQTWLGEWIASVGEHHERWDGAGYPQGLAGTNIALSARIVAVADAFDAMTATATNGGRMSARDARAELAECAGSQFDPTVVRAFLAINMRRLRLAMGPVSWLANLPIVGQIPLTPAITGVAGSGLAALSLFAGGAGTQADAAVAEITPPPVIAEAPPPEPVVATTVLSTSGPTTTTTVVVPPAGPAPQPPSEFPVPPTPPPTAPDLEVVVDEDDVVPVPLESETDVQIVIPPAHGRLGDLPDGRYSYRPDADYHGTDQTVYRRCGVGGCSDGTVSIRVRPVNDTPVARADQAVGIEDGPAVTIVVLANDQDKDGDRLVVTSVSGVTKGSVDVLANDSLRFRPAPDANGRGGLTYRVSDGHGGTDTASVTVDLTAVNDPPEFVVGADVATPEDSGQQAITGWATGLSPGPADESGQTMSFETVTADPSLFSVDPTVDPQGGLRFTPAPDAFGSTTITVAARDNGGTAAGGRNTSVGQVATITVSPVADDPVAVADDFTTAEDTPLTVGAASGLLDNDTDVDGDGLTVTTTPVAGPSDGGVVLSADGSFTYTPDPDFAGTDSLTYEVSDGTGRSDTAVVTIDVESVPDAPVATPDAFEAVEDTTLNVPAVSGLTANDADPDGDPLAVTTTPVVPPTKGALTLNANGSFQYTADADENGSDSFTYEITDGTGRSDTAAVALTITPVNDRPAFTKGANDQVNEDSGPRVVPAWATAIGAGPADESGQTVGFTVTAGDPSLFSSQPAVSPTGTLTYTPAPNANGSTSISVRGTDNGGTANGGVDTSAAQSATITVNAVNDAPEFAAGADQVVAEDAGPQSIPAWATGLSAGPSDESSQSWLFDEAVVDESLFAVQPSVSSNGTLTYTTAPNANGSTTVTISMVDDGGTTNGGVDTSPGQVVAFTITAVPDDPVAVDDGFTTPEDVTLNQGATGGLLANDTDVDGDPLSVTTTPVTPPSSGSVTLHPDGSFDYVPDLNASGLDSFVYEVTDGTGRSATATATISVGVAPDPPSAVDDAYGVAEDGALIRNVAQGVLANDFDVDGDPLTVDPTPVVDVTKGALTLNADGSFQYIPDPDVSGTDTFTYQIDDGTGLTDTAVVTITITAVNDVPSFAVGADRGVLEDASPVSVPGWATAISSGPADESGQALLFSVAADDPGLFSAQPAVSPAGTLTFTPAPDASGSTSVTVSLSDDGGTANGGVDTSADQAFTITVTAVNDVPSFAVGSDRVVLEDAAAVSVPGWATAISSGPADESGQALLFSVAADDPGLFSAQPAVSPAGTLTFTPAPDASGSTSVTVSLSDDGGTANGGVDTSADQAFTITITAVNDPPVAVDDPDGDDDPDDFQVVTIGDLDIAAADLVDNDTDPEGDTLSLVPSGPTPTARGSVTCSALSCTYDPIGLATGTDTFNYTVSDGNGGQDTATVTVTIADYVASPDQGQVVINEVLYDGTTRLNFLTLERSDFIELYNSGAQPADISGWLLTDNNLVAGDLDSAGGFEHVFPQGTVIPAKDFLVLWIGRDRSATVPGFTNVIGGGVIEQYYGSWTNWLEEAGDSVTMHDERRRVVDSVVWGSTTSPDYNEPIPPSMGVWNARPNNETGLAGSGVGRSIALTPNGRLTADGFCWEHSASGNATCPGALTTLDTDTYSGRVTSVGRHNDGGIEAGGPYSIAEGEPLALLGSGPSAPPSAFTWDLDNDGQYDDATGISTTVPWSSLFALGLDDDGSYPISLQYNGGPTAAATVTIENTAPTLETTGAASVAAGGTFTLDLAAIDPGDDTISAWIINWGDGQIEDIVGNPSSVTHRYAQAGFTYPILASATDEDGSYLQNELLVPSYDGDRTYRYAPTTGSFIDRFDTPDDPIEAYIDPDGRLLVSGETSSTVRRHNAVTGGFIDTIVAPASGGLDWAEGVASGPDGNLYVASYKTDRILRYDGSTGEFIDVFAATGVKDPYDVAFGPDGDLYVGSWTANRVDRFDGATGADLGAFVSAGSGGLNTPEQMTFGPDGNLYVASFGSKAILRYDGSTGAFMNQFVNTASGGGIEQPSGLAFGPDGNLYVGMHKAHSVLRYDGTTGAFIDEYVTPGDGGLTKPVLFTFVPGHQVTINP